MGATARPRGYIQLERDIEESEIWMKQPPAWLKIWLHIRIRVNWKYHSSVPRGTQLFNFYESQASLVGVTHDQWKRCLQWLRKKGMISTRRTARGIWITDLTYDATQTPQRTDESTIPEWLAPILNAWRSITGGELDKKHATQLLLPLRKQHGDAAILTRVQTYLAQTRDPKHISLRHFCQTFGAWGHSEENPAETKATIWQLKQQLDAQEQIYERMKLKGETHTKAFTDLRAALWATRAAIAGVPSLKKKPTSGAATQSGPSSQ